MSAATRSRLSAFALVAATAGFLALGLAAPQLSDASSHREAPLIAADPLADNTDVYAYRSPSNDDNVVIVANYIPLELPEGGPNYNTFGPGVRYEIHVKNQTSLGALGTAMDDITYRFTFALENERPSTFFNILLGDENLKATYTMEKRVGTGGFQTVVTNGIVPPNNIGPRSIEGDAGLMTSYDALVQSAITTASSGERVFAGPRDDPFFVDLGGVFDLGGVRKEFGEDPEDEGNARDAVAGFNTHSIVMEIPISSLQKDGQGVDDAESILDPSYVIGVWASASRQQVKTLSATGGTPTYTGPWIQVSRLGMPLTNEAVIPIGDKDRWNATTPYDAEEQDFAEYFVNPELAIYMGNGQFAAAVPALSEDLVVPMNSYPAIGDPDGDGSAGFDFTNGADGVFDLVEAGVDLSGTAFAVPLRPAGTGSPSALAGDGEPRRADLLPIFYFGVPNLNPYQLATGKTAGPLSDGKPFVNNFLPVTQTATGDLYGGDMLRLNMAVPVTDRGSQEFSDFARLGLVRAAAIGLTAAPFNQSTDLEFIPHMDGFPNGRRLEDDVTTIAFQAVGGIVLAAVGLPYDGATAGDYSDLLSPNFVSALNFVAGPTKNDLALDNEAFPYLATPHNGYSYVKQLTAMEPNAFVVSSEEGLGLGVPQGFILDQNYPNPFGASTTVEYHVAEAGDVRLEVFDIQGRLVSTLVSEARTSGTHTAEWDARGLASGTYFYRLSLDGRTVSTRKAALIR